MGNCIKEMTDWNLLEQPQQQNGAPLTTLSMNSSLSPKQQQQALELQQQQSENNNNMGNTTPNNNTTTPNKTAVRRSNSTTSNRSATQQQQQSAYNNGGDDTSSTDPTYTGSSSHHNTIAHTSSSNNNSNSYHNRSGSSINNNSKKMDDNPVVWIDIDHSKFEVATVLEEESVAIVDTLEQQATKPFSESPTMRIGGQEQIKEPYGEIEDSKPIHLQQEEQHHRDGSSNKDDATNNNNPDGIIVSLQNEIRVLKQQQNELNQLRIAEMNGLRISLREQYDVEKEELLRQLRTEENTKLYEQQQQYLLEQKSLIEQNKKEKQEFLDVISELQSQINEMKLSSTSLSSQPQGQQLQQQPAGLKSTEGEDDSAAVIEKERLYQKLIQDLEDQLEETNGRSRKEITELKNQLEMQKRQTLNEKDHSALEARFNVERRELQNQIEIILKERDESENQLRIEYEAAIEQEILEKNALIEEIQCLKDEMNTSKSVYEVDEVLAQLDLIEKEHKEVLAAKDQALQEKDTIISALGHQMAESKRQMSIVEQQLSEQILLTELEQNKVVNLEETVQFNKLDYEALQEAHDLYVKNATKEKEKACEEAREEMIQRAEEQFQQANELYRRLKVEFNASQKKVTSLEEEIKKLNEQHTVLKEQKHVQEQKLQAEILRLQAANTKATSDLTEHRILYEEEIAQLQQSQQTLQAELRRSEDTCTSIQSTLAAIIASKEKLQFEYDEMKAVCEELMVMVEASANTGATATSPSTTTVSSNTNRTPSNKGRYNL